MGEGWAGNKMLPGGKQLLKTPNDLRSISYSTCFSWIPAMQVPSPPIPMRVWHTLALLGISVLGVVASALWCHWRDECDGAGERCAPAWNQSAS